MLDELLRWLVLSKATESALALEASDAADALGVNACPSEGPSALDAVEGGTARMVNLGEGEGSS